MEKKAAFISRSFVLIILGATLLAILSGCQQASGNIQSITGDTPGFFNHYFVYPFSVLLKTFATWFQGSYGFSIIFVTILIRLVLLPMMIKQSKDQMIMRDKMAVVQPEIKALQEKMKKVKDDETKAKLQQETMTIYKNYGVNPIASLGGCLPLLIQFPILMGFFYAIQRTPEIASHSFLWFNLGHSDLVLPLIAVAIYFVQFKITLIGLDEAQKKQMAMFGYLSPIMMGVFSLSAPAAIPLYWTVGGIFLIFQSLLTKRLLGQKTVEKEAVGAER